MNNPVEIELAKGVRLLSADGVTATPQRFAAKLHFVGGQLEKLPPKGDWPRDRYIGRGAVTGTGGLLVKLDVELAHDGSPLCRAMSVAPEPPSTEPITTSSARVPLLRLMKLAVATATVEIGPPDAEGMRNIIHGSEAPVDAFIREHRDGARPPRRGSPLTSDDLRRTARVYIEAGKSKRYRSSQRKAVMLAEGVSPATAARRIRMARERGFIPD